MENELIYKIVVDVLKKFKVKHYSAQATTEAQLKNIIGQNTLQNELSIGKFGDTYVVATKVDTGDVVILGSSNNIPSGAKALGELLDVDDNVSLAANGSVLKFNGTSWVAGSLDIPDTLNELSDVNITSPTNNQVLKWNGTEWVNSAFPVAQVPTQLYQLTDVYSEGDSGAPALTDGKILMYKSATNRWEPSDIVDNSNNLGGISFSIIPFPLSTALSSSDNNSFFGLFRFTAPWTAKVSGVRIYLPNSVTGLLIDYKLLTDADITYGGTLTHGTGVLSDAANQIINVASGGTLVNMPLSGANALDLTKNSTYWLYLRLTNGSNGVVGGRTITGQSGLNNISPVYVNRVAGSSTIASLAITSANIPGVGASIGFLPYFEIY